jgi:hypothetical protein
MVGVNRKTLYGWVKEGKWIRAKCSASHAPSVLAEQYYAQLEALNHRIAKRDEPIPTKEEADIQRKLSLTISSVKNERRTVCETIDLFEGFSRHLRKRNLELADKVLTHMNEYVKDMSLEGWIRNPGSELREEAEFDEQYKQWVATHRPPEPPADAAPTTEPNPPTGPTVPGFPTGNIHAGNDDAAQSNHDGSQANDSTNETPALAALHTPSSLHTPSRKKISTNGVYNGVQKNVENHPKPATTAEYKKTTKKKLSTKQEIKWGVTPPLPNRKARRLQERTMRSAAKKSKR